MHYTYPLLLPLLLSILYLLAAQIGRPNPDLKPKIFVLGLSKTGTTSIGNALTLLGYKRLGWKDIKSRYLVQAFIHGNTATLLEQTKYYDAFEDLPWPYLYREVAELYPDAKFVLSLRKDEQTWVKSLRRHLARGDWKAAEFFYGAEQVAGNEDVVLSAYRNHTANVRAYFADKPERFEELSIDDGDVNWTKLCRLARCPGDRAPTVGFPKSNTAASWHDGDFSANMHQLWSQTLNRLEEVMARLYYVQRIPLANVLLQQVAHFIDVVEQAVCQVQYRFEVQSLPPLFVK